MLHSWNDRPLEARSEGLVYGLLDFVGASVPGQLKIQVSYSGNQGWTVCRGPNLE